MHINAKRVHTIIYDNTTNIQRNVSFDIIIVFLQGGRRRTHLTDDGARPRSRLLRPLRQMPTVLQYYAVASSDVIPEPCCHENKGLCTPPGNLQYLHPGTRHRCRSRVRYTSLVVHTRATMTALSL